MLPTTPSTFPVIERFGAPYALINPGSRAENVVAIVHQVVHSLLPEGYREIDDIVRDSENNPRRAAALSRARKRIAATIEEEFATYSIATLRLKRGLSQLKVAEMLGNSQSSYSLIESGRRADMLHSTFEKLAEILQVSRDELAKAIQITQKNLS